MAMSIFIKAGLLAALTILPATNSLNGLHIKSISNQYRFGIQQDEHSLKPTSSTLNSWNDSCNVPKTFPCDCYPHIGSFKGPVVDCSHKNLSFIPRGIPVDAIELNISHNSLRNLSSGVFKKLLLLEKLDLSNNNIAYFVSGTFMGLNRLRTLLLNDNHFNQSPATFANDVFAPLTSLTYLNIKSRPDNPQGHYPDVALGRLISLETLLITGLSSTDFGAGVQNLTSLRTLDFSGSPDFTSLSKHTFKHFRNIAISILNLSFCDLKWIDRETFVNLPFIDTIDYSFNQNLELTGVGKSTFGLQNSTIRKITLQRVHKQTSLSVFTHDILRYLQKTQLEEFYAQNNSIGLLGEGAIDFIPLSVKVLDVSWNNIQICRNQIFQLLRLRNVEIFDASYQEVYRTENPGLTFHGKGVLKIDTGFGIGPQKLPKMNANETFILKHFTIQLPPKLWFVEFSHTYKLRFTIPRIELANSSVKIANFANNLLSRWEGPVLGVETLEHLDLSGNNCDFVSPYFFAYATGLKTLLLGNNKLGPKLIDFTFHNLSSLIHLNMESNRLEGVGLNLFSSLSNLTRLNLSGNYISDWNADLSCLRQLEVLDLSNNKLIALPKRLLEDLDSIRESRPVEIDIHGNEFKCSCQTEDFVRWFSWTKVRLKNFVSTFCTLDNGTRISLMESKAIVRYLDVYCRSYVVLIGLLSGCFAIILVVVLGAIIRRYRWKLRYLYFMAANRRERSGYQSLDPTEGKPFGFDAFISYEDSDRAFITQHIIPRLEGEVGLKLCIDKRDFIPGLYVTDNIMNAIQNSRKTVVLLSLQFLKSKWCMYELNMARMEGIYNDRQLLVVVLLEEVPTAILAAEALEVINGQTYIDWTENEYGQALFWERLIVALKSDT